mmetsp:Transcript_18048/g.68440  ORF Transcript_18048/g.68440 Transcript_18048/m.68440 type:complete len:218 (+) Transcript_18048:39-692(+)
MSYRPALILQLAAPQTFTYYVHDTAHDSAETPSKRRLMTRYGTKRSGPSPQVLWSSRGPDLSLSLGGISHGPLARDSVRLLLVLLPQRRNVVIQRVIRIRRGQQRLDAEENCANLQSWRPLVLQDVQADAAELVHVGVVDPREEPHLGWRHGIVRRQEQLQHEVPRSVWRLGWPGYHYAEVAQVVLIRRGADARHWLRQQSLRLLDDAAGQSHDAAV